MGADPNELPYSAYPLSEYKKGAIVTLTLENFMKHVSAYFRFTPGLNFIFGLNGSGKSSLVCALILGHGGEPKITGRCSKIAQYVTRGKSHATITIELSNGDGVKTTILQRKIVIHPETGGVTNEYRIDRKHLRLEDFKNEISKFNIKVDNLCQVLPQERVAEFSGLNSQQLLLSTEMSIGDVELYNDHMKLIEADKTIRDTNTRIERTQAQILQFKGFKTALEPTIEKINESGKYQKEIDILEKKKAFLDFTNHREELASFQSSYKKCQEDFKAAEEKVNELKKESNKMDRLINKYEQQISKQKSDLNSYESFYSRLESSNREYRTKKTSIIKKLNENKSELKTRYSKLQKLNEEIELETERLEQFNQKNDNVEEQLEIINQGIKDIEKQKINISDLEEEMNKCRTERNCAVRSIQAAKSREEEVYSRNFKKSVLEANRIFLERRDEFQGQVFNILITHVRPKSKQFVKYFERAIPNRDWEMFLFEKEQDLRHFRDLLEEQPHPISVAMALVPQFHQSLFEPDFDAEQFRRYGIEGSLHDLYDAPKMVQAYLNKTAGLNKRPYGRNVSPQEIDVLGNHFRTLCTPDRFITFTKSRYQQGIVSTSSDSWKPDRIMHHLYDFDKSLQNKNREIIHRCEASLNEIQEKMEEKKAKNNEYEVQLKELRTKKIEIQKGYKVKENYQKTIQEKINVKTSIEKDIEKLKGITINSEKEKIREMIDGHERLIKTFVNVLNKTSDNLQERFIISYEHSIIEPLKTEFQKLYTTESRKQEERRQQMATLKRQVDEAKQECKRYYDIACDKTGLTLKRVEDEQVQNLVLLFENYPSTIQEIDCSIESYRAKCDQYRGVNENTLTQYKDFSEKIANEEESLVDLQRKVDESKEQIQTIKDGWVSRLKKIVDKIDKNYSNFMQKLGYKGTVKLSNIDNDENFENCGINIQVKFRENAEFADLQSHAQSGGERSVATVVYMLALQEQAVVPFRIIDEINQGMDANNERNVFGLFDYVAKTNQSQYFLLTPKIISGLKYTEQMSIINILSFNKEEE